MLKLVTALALSACPLCAPPAPRATDPPEPKEAVQLIGGTDRGEILRIEVTDQGLVAHDLVALTRPDGSALGHCSTLHEGPRGLIVYDHHRATLTVLHSDGSGAYASKPIGAQGTVERRGMCVTPAGAVLVLDHIGAELRVYSNDWAHRDEPENGTPFVRIKGMGVIEAMAFADDGTLYALGNRMDADVIASRVLFEVSLNTGVATPIADLRVRDLDALVYADGMLYATDANANAPARLYRIDPDSGRLDDLGEIGDITITGLARWRELDFFRGCG